VSDDHLRIVDDADADAEALRRRLEPFAASARRYLDAELGRRQTRPVPPLRLPSNGRRIAWAAAGVVLAAAAALVLWVAGPTVASEGDQTDPDQAMRTVAEDSGDGGVAESKTPKPTSQRPSVESIDEETIESLEALDAEAQRLWHAGNLAGAAERLRRITELGGDHRYVELAYADLVTLARQRGKTGEIQSLWREYLERFPRGRFSRDARASLRGD